MTICQWIFNLVRVICVVMDFFIYCVIVCFRHELLLVRDGLICANAGKCMWTKHMHIWWKHAVSINTPYIRYVSVFGFCEFVVFQIPYNVSIIRGKQGTTWCYYNFLIYL